ncbi:MAG TPA: discoidin domain-containing protein [Herpetosiphonaceae bacterium]|nr:discoidin domain-containing protein [Herpetosiphonaceae bacterium]
MNHPLTPRRFRSVHIMLLALFLLSLAFFAPAASEAQTTNLALNKPATASSIEGAGFEAGKAVDGSGATRWASLEGADPQWIRIDLGAPATVSRVRLNWEAAYARGYRVEISPDGVAWTALYSTSTGDGGIDDLAVAGSGRFLRIYGTARGTAWGYSLWEIEVFGTATTPPTATPPPTATKTPGPSTPVPGANLALNKPATASSIEGAGLEAGKAVDGSGTTRWASATSDPQWIRIDLGAATVNRVVLRWEAAYARGYRVEISADGNAWTALYSTSTGDGGIDDLAVAGSGRFLRVYGTQRATQWGYSLWEIEVFGTATTPPTATPSPTAPAGWNLVWSDEFNQAAVNTANWSFIVSGEGGGNNERQYYTNGQNASIVADSGAEDGKALQIEARRENPAGYQCWYGACQYTSARMVTQGKRSWQYGKIEARMKLPAGNGLWPAFWMMGNNGNWPASGEIDIMELVGGSQCGSECGDNHTHGYMWWSENGDRSDGAQARPLASGTYADAYHTFGVEWDSQQIRWLIDGQPLIRADNGQPLILSVTGSGKTEFHQPFYILMNIAVGGDWPLDPPASTAFPKRMYVDWVRVYQK